MGSGQYVLQMRKGFAYTVCYPRKIAGWAVSGARYATNLGHHSHSTKPLCIQRKPQVLFIIRMAGSNASVLPTMGSLLCTARAAFTEGHPVPEMPLLGPMVR